MKLDSSAQNNPTLGLSKPKESAADVANRIASGGKTTGKPNRVIQGKGNANLDKDAFFQLMMTQVKNQDPTNPLKSHEMSAQLAQFSSLEQMSNIHSVLNDMKKAQGNDSQYQALSMIGKTISGDNARVDRLTTDETHDLQFNINDSASEIQVNIVNAKGDVVRTLELSNQAKGPVKLSWDGKDKDGSIAPTGSYKMMANAKDLQGHALSVDMNFQGAVTGVQFSDRGPLLMIGNKSVPFKDVKQIQAGSEMPVPSAKMEMRPGPQAMPMAEMPDMQALGSQIQQKLMNHKI